ncbi:hypothetical protein K7X08_023393 [Anisodus acutangulus]|uniref:Retrotransposon gag domain-containing protein n=1 Tax=Anisodus acutangulus TaxID=402998 RepID=A0A9Q1LID2_9SOLA|nr:hypothetical protein K7X08_023393 [Anisodus acutangulus]
MIRTGESVAREIHSLKEAFKNIQTSKGHEGLEYEDLCMHPDIELPVGYKMPKFDLFDGKGNPYSHLRSYCDKLIGVGKNQAIIMKLFVRGLTGEALDWYTSQDPQKWRNWGTMAQDFVDRFKFNTDTVLDRFYLMKFEKKSRETFREYAMKWRAYNESSTPIEESEMTTLFVQSLKDATYYERMISVIDEVSRSYKDGRFHRRGNRNKENYKLCSIASNKSYDETKHCAYHSGIPGHDTENCYALRDKIEALIKEGVIQLKGPSSNVNDNPLPNHDDANVNMITVDEEHNLEGTIVPIQIEEKVESSAFVTPMITDPSEGTAWSRSVSSKVAGHGIIFSWKSLINQSPKEGRRFFTKVCSTSGSVIRQNMRHSGIKGGQCSQPRERIQKIFIDEEEAKRLR